MNLAYLEGKLVMASIVRHFRITLAPHQQVQPVQDTVTLPIKDPLRVILSNRDGLPSGQAPNTPSGQ